MLMESRDFKQDFIEQISAASPIVTKKSKDHIKLLLAVTVVILATVVLIESFVLAVISSNYYGVFEPGYYDEDTSYDDNPEFYESDVEEE